MAGILFLTQRIPYPPNKGERIQSFNMLRHLTQRYRVLVGTFIDDPADKPGIETLRRSQAASNEIERGTPIEPCGFGLRFRF